MIIEEYENSLGQPMIRIIDTDKNTAESMPLEVYEAKEAAKEASGTLS